MHDPILRVQDLTWRRGDFRLDIAAWQVSPGSVVGLIGANGAGKSSLLRLLPGLDAPDGGEINVLGRHPRQDPVFVRSHVGFMTDTLSLPDLTVDRLLWWMSGFYPTWDAGLVRDLIQRFELDTRAGTRSLSKGQGTRLRLILAMAFQPRLLVLDEPATGLDLNSRLALLHSVTEVMQDPQRAVIVASHDLEDVRQLSTHLTLLSQGKIVAEGPTHELVPEGRSLRDVLVERNWTR